MSLSFTHVPFTRGGLVPFMHGGLGGRLHGPCRHSSVVYDIISFILLWLERVNEPLANLTIVIGIGCHSLGLLQLAIQSLTKIGAFQIHIHLYFLSLGTGDAAPSFFFVS